MKNPCFSFILLLLLCSWGLFPTGAQAGGLVIAYTGNTFGKHTPCPT